MGISFDRWFVWQALLLLPLTGIAQQRTGSEFLKEVYRIGLFLPMHSHGVYFDETTQEFVFPSEAQAAAEYYLGALLAFEDLAVAGMRMHLEVIDASKDSLALDSVLKQPRMRELDLMFGPFSGTASLQLYQHSAKYRIPLVSPFSVLPVSSQPNEYYIQANPSLLSHCRFLFDHIYNLHYYDRVILVGRPQNKTDRLAMDYFQQLNAQRIESGRYPLPMAVLDDSSGMAASRLADSLSFVRPNVVIVASTDEPFVQSVLTTLASAAHDVPVRVFGLPNWKIFERTPYWLLDTVHATISATFFLNPLDSAVMIFQANYQKRHGVAPTVFSVHGYDQAYYFGKQLYRFGKMMMGVFPPPNYTPLATRFQVVPVMESETVTHRENRGLTLLQFRQARWTRLAD